MSEYLSTLDDKGRLTLAGKLRDELQKSERPDEVVAHPSEDGFVVLYPHEHWKKIEDGLRAIPDTNQRNAAIRYYMGKSERISLDKAGRLLLPQKHREAAGLEKEVIVRGALFKIEIWQRRLLEPQLVKEEEIRLDSAISEALPL